MQETPDVRKERLVRDIGGDQEVLVDELRRVSHVGVDAADPRRREIHLVDMLRRKEPADGFLIEKIQLLAAARDDLVPKAPQPLHERLTHHAAMTSNVYTHMFFRLKVEG
jgi:hypothetical protein